MGKQSKHQEKLEISERKSATFNSFKGKYIMHIFDNFKHKNITFSEDEYKKLMSKEGEIKKAFKSVKKRKVAKKMPKRHVSDSESEMIDTSDGSDSD